MYVELFMDLYLLFLQRANLQSKQQEKKNKLSEESLQRFETD